jgi:hypothetical protein
MLQHSPSDTAANIALLEDLLDRAALVITASSPIDVPGTLSVSHPGRLITAQWRRTQGALHNLKA